MSDVTVSPSGRTCTAQATVSDAWGTPSYAIFTVQQKNGESYVDTAVTGRAGLSSTSFNGCLLYTSRCV